MINPFITSILSMVITLALAYGIDQWIFFQFRYGKPLSDLGHAYIGNILGGLVLCAVWLALIWIILVKCRRNVAVSIIFIAVGLLAFVWFPLELVSPFWSVHLYLFNTIPANLQYSGLFIAALGFLMLLLPKHKLD
jgi:hypothetical protein